MRRKEADEIIACLPGGKRHFYYFRDRYAQMLLSYFVGDGKPVREIRRSRFAKLLDRPLVKGILESQGSGMLSADALNSVWPTEYECYLLTLGVWGKHKGWNRWYHQTSRRGTNLVLQLNFSSKHDRPYYRLLQPGEEHPFEYDEHPIAREGHHTLAWARLDIDVSAGEALIEEIQSDWVRLAVRGKMMVEALEHDEERRRRVVQRYFRGAPPDPRSLNKYVSDVLAVHMPLWREAMLAAAIWFLREELGVTQVLYHTFATGNLLKGITGYAKPPKSLYTDLPRRFCFEKTETAPAFLETDIRRRFRHVKRPPKLLFWRMELPPTRKETQETG